MHSNILLTSFVINRTSKNSINIDFPICKFMEEKRFVKNYTAPLKFIIKRVWLYLVQILTLIPKMYSFIQLERLDIILFLKNYIPILALLNALNIVNIYCNLRSHVINMHTH